MSTLRYTVDTHNIIVDTSDYWDTFAEENGGHELNSVQVIGRDLFDFITGDITRMYVDTLLQRSRILKAPQVKPYRCDSPELRRYMEMTIEPDQGYLVLTHSTVKTEPQGHSIHYVGRAEEGGEPLSTAQEVGAQKVNALILRCSICNRIRVENHCWCEGATAYRQGLITSSALPVTYTVCANCNHL